VATVSPSMDIQVASNFERYLYHLFGDNPKRVLSAFAELRDNGKISFTPAEMLQVRKEFCSASVDQVGTLATIGKFYHETGYLLDPHTAVGVRAALDLLPANSVRICLATAHPAKFGDAVQEATGKSAPVPASISDLDGKPTRCEVMEADLQKVKEYVIINLGKAGA
jgi:threonine synthase